MSKYSTKLQKLRTKMEKQLNWEKNKMSLTKKYPQSGVHRCAQSRVHLLEELLNESV